MRQRLQATLRRMVIRLSILPFRAAAYIFHATGLERFYKPRFTRYAALIELTPEVVGRLPKYSMTLTGARMDPMNLIFIGSEVNLRAVFALAGWSRAHPANPLLLLYAGLTVLIRRHYASWPFTPHYVNIGLQDMSFQMHTSSNSFRQRHHLRIWRTGVELPGHQRVWVGAGSFDRDIKLSLRPPWVDHALDPDLDAERRFIVRSLEDEGARRLRRVPMTELVLASAPRTNPSGNRYFTDGLAEVIQV